MPRLSRAYSAAALRTVLLIEVCSVCVPWRGVGGIVVLRSFFFCVSSLFRKNHSTLQFGACSTQRQREETATEGGRGGRGVLGRAFAWDFFWNFAGILYLFVAVSGVFYGLLIISYA